MIFIPSVYRGNTLVVVQRDPIFLPEIQLVYLILIMLEDEDTQFIMYPLFLTERGFISANVISRNCKDTNPCQYSLTFSEGILLQFICCPHDSDNFSSIPNSLANHLQRILIEMVHQPLYVFLCRFELLEVVFDWFS